MVMSNPRPNPYVGPRAFETGETLYGREREVPDLLDLLIAERVVLLYSPSGAGKTSLISAGLIPQLAREGFHVLPVIRVNQELPVLEAAPAEAAPPPPGLNRYLYSTLLSLEEELDEEQQMHMDQLTGLGLAQYLE